MTTISLFDFAGFYSQRKIRDFWNEAEKNNQQLTSNVPTFHAKMSTWDKLSQNMDNISRIRMEVQTHSMDYEIHAVFGHFLQCIVSNQFELEPFFRLS